MAAVRSPEQAIEWLGASAFGQVTAGCPCKPAERAMGPEGEELLREKYRVSRFKLAASVAIHSLYNPL